MSTSVEDLAGGYHFSFKVVICGDSGVGKTTLLDSEGTSAYSRGGNSDNTVGINFRIKFYEVEGQTYRVQFWDCPGAGRYRNLNSRFCAGAAGAILVFDVNNRITFENIELWCEQVDKFGSMLKVLVGNKVMKKGACVVTEEVSQNDGRRVLKALRLMHCQIKILVQYFRIFLHNCSKFANHQNRLY